MENLLNINLSNARGTDEDFTTYKNRQKSNNKILKLYRHYGREAFQMMFPNGVKEAMENSTEQTTNEGSYTGESSTSSKGKTNYQSKAGKTQNTKAQSTQTQKSGRGK